MYIGYFYDSNEMYQNRIFIDDIQECLKIGMEYRNLVPHIVFTENSNIIFEIKDSKVISPHFSEEEINELRSCYTPYPKDINFNLALNNYLEILGNCFLIKNAKIFFTEVRNRERKLMAIAARDNINLNKFDGFKPAELYITKLIDKFNLPTDL